MSQDIPVNNLIIHELTQQKFESISPNNTELYITDEPNKYRIKDIDCMHIVNDETISGKKTFIGKTIFTSLHGITPEKTDNSNKIATVGFVNLLIAELTEKLDAIESNCGELPSTGRGDIGDLDGTR